MMAISHQNEPVKTQVFAAIVPVINNAYKWTIIPRDSNIQQYANYKVIFILLRLKIINIEDARLTRRLIAIPALFFNNTKHQNRNLLIIICANTF